MATPRAASAYHTPGHSPGHTVFYHATASVAFLGDRVWAGDDGGLTAPFWGNSDDMTELCESGTGLAGRIPAFDVAAMGHGGPLLTGGHDAHRTPAGRL